MRLALSLAFVSWAATASAQAPVASPPATVVEQPLFLEAVAAPDHPSAAGDFNASVAIHLMLGTQTGVRTQLGFDLTDRSAVLVEGYYGGVFTRFASGEAIGGGVRWQFRRSSEDGINQLSFAPGASILSIFNGHERTMLAPTLELAWLRAFSPNGGWGWELGLSVGVGIDVGGSASGQTGDISPLISGFTGFRF